jgi:2'-5' RNA ligase
MRLFTAILLPDAVRDHLRCIGEQVNRFAIEHEIRLTAPENLHVTLKFLGEVSDPLVARLIDALRAVSVAPADLLADRLLLFPSHGLVRIVAAGLGGDVPSVVRLNDQIETAVAPLGFTREARPFAPHITFGRNKPGRYQKVASSLRKHPPPGCRWPGPTFTATHFALVQSVTEHSGSKYTPIATFPALDRDP